MFKLLVAAALVCVAFGAPQNVKNYEAHHDFIPILSEEISVEHDGNFRYNYESGDGTKVQEQGTLKVFDAEHSGEVVQGSYEYKTPEGQNIAVSYTADENGYHPSGDSLPQAPAIPAQIARALQYQAEHPYVEPQHVKTVEVRQNIPFNTNKKY